MTAEKRLRFALWLQEAEKQNTRVLKNLMLKRGPIRYRDGNQCEYLADFVPVEKKFYPYSDCIAILDEWFRIHAEEGNLREKLTISGLSQALRAGKREGLARKLADIVDVRVDTELRIGRKEKNNPKESGTLASCERRHRGKTPSSGAADPKRPRTVGSMGEASHYQRKRFRLTTLLARGITCA